MVKTVIEAFPQEKRIPRDDGSKIIHIAECFGKSIQSENFSGFPSVFILLQSCILSCTYCDSHEVWRKGNPYSVWELCDLLKKEGVVDDLKMGHHLVLTGGSPLLQQDALVEFLEIFQELYKFKPFVEIENECVIVPRKELLEYVNLWNNSPKLSSSCNPTASRYKPDVILLFKDMENAFFKFVVTCEEDWDEIKSDFLDTGLIDRKNIVLMPEGVTREELQQKYEWLVELCCREGVRMTDRLHVTIWNKKTGV